MRPAPTVFMHFAAEWQAEILRGPPLIAPARSYMWPLEVAGEAEAMGRGAMRVMVRPRDGEAFLATCALGFADEAMPSGVWSCPDPRQICALAGGYAYIADIASPERPVHLPMRPVVEVRAATEAGLMLFTGFHTVMAWGANGLRWETKRLSWEGLRLDDCDASTLRGAGWDLTRDREVPFSIDLRTGEHAGGSAPGQ